MNQSGKTIHFSKAFIKSFPIVCRMMPKVSSINSYIYINIQFYEIHGLKYQYVSIPIQILYKLKK